MRCEICEGIAVISTRNGTLCETHFKKKFESVVMETIKKYKLIRRGEIIAVANSGGKDSLSLLYVLSKNFGNKNKIISITIDEGIAGYRNKTMETMKKYCDSWKVEYCVYSYKDFVGATMDSITKIREGIPCAACGVLRRHMLNFAAMETGADKIATAHNMDDEAENVLMNLFQNDLEKMVRLGPVSGVVESDGFVPRIKPLMFLSEKETMLFSILNGITALHTPCPYAGFGFRGVMSRKIKEIESEMAGSKRNLIDVMMALRDTCVKNSTYKTISNCKLCKMPSSNDICEACLIKIQINGIKSN
ncbi:MAG: adenine nucleotide alpha hydrolase family protein [Candidatus Parvarchaeota archaeon]|jgi:uncharacterized protein (TIGR00269 family)|nr:adenine nucleotide alpha hydrolase family protein [Candidatus Parvarchaeota archaeon]MCL5101420.1 adenine nucleotide alpha hydrolase family protein [Candidatus Parvarchaeota archaeon]